MTTERTFIAIKPDGVQRNLVGEIIGRFEKKGYKLVGLKLVRVTQELAETHYAEHKGKNFFPGLVKFITSGPVVALVFEGKGVIAGARLLIGATNPANSTPGTIRGDLAVDVGRNIIHGSDSVDSATKEIALWFKPEELATYTLNAHSYIYE
jgi:nucleoside-diphosphate kinase